jgi:hypothetical protein
VESQLIEVMKMKMRRIQFILGGIRDPFEIDESDFRFEKHDDPRLSTDRRITID